MRVHSRTTRVSLPIKSQTCEQVIEPCPATLLGIKDCVSECTNVFGTFELVFMYPNKLAVRKSIAVEYLEISWRSIRDVDFQDT